MLFVPRSTYSYVSLRFASEFEMLYDVLDAPICVSTPLRYSVIITHVNPRACLFCLWDYRLAYLVILYIIDFDIILGMTWLYPYYVVLNYNTKSVTIEILGRKIL